MSQEDFDNKLLSLIHNSKDPDKAIEIMFDCIISFLGEGEAA